MIKDAVQASSSGTTSNTVNPGGHSPDELYWCSLQKWLQECGYMLRARYLPGWVPSWEGTKKLWVDFEDGQVFFVYQIMDATRIADGTVVVLKLTEKSVHPYEAEIGTFFSTEPLASDARNHCVPIYEILQVPDDENKVILVMPLLRENDDPRFDTCGEAVEFFRQVFEGLQFMHKHHVAHRDCMDLNIMMDATPMYPVPYHPANTNMRRDYRSRAKHYTRTQRPPKYYFIDFGLSRRYDPTDGPPLEDPIWGGDKTVPEFQNSNDPCNPFPTDVYYLGNMIRKNFLHGNDSASAKLGFEFIKPLVTDMVQSDPEKRPNMDEVVTRFEAIRCGLSSWKLRSRVVKRGDSAVAGFFRSITHWSRRIRFIVMRVPALPVP